MPKDTQTDLIFKSKLGLTYSYSIEFRKDTTFQI